MSESLESIERRDQEKVSKPYDIRGIQLEALKGKAL